MSHSDNWVSGKGTGNLWSIDVFQQTAAVELCHRRAIKKIWHQTSESYITFQLFYITGRSGSSSSLWCPSNLSSVDAEAPKRRAASQRRLQTPGKVLYCRRQKYLRDKLMYWEKSGGFFQRFAVCDSVLWQCITKKGVNLAIYLASSEKKKRKLDYLCKTESLSHSIRDFSYCDSITKSWQSICIL